VHKKIFLTGEPGAGKSTAIKNYIFSNPEIVPTGFKTISIPVNDTDYDVHILHYQVSEYDERALTKQSIIGQRVMHAFPPLTFENAFNKRGVELLDDAVSDIKEGKANLLIMDELGFMENKAIPFQKKVLEVLNMDIPIIAVVKEAETKFLSEVRAVKGFSFKEIKKEDRGNLYGI
jgi:nucleoside-triphosphatase